MAEKKTRRISPDELQIMARVFGIEIAPEGLESMAQQVSAQIEFMSRLDPAELHDLEPASVFHIPLGK